MKPAKARPTARLLSLGGTIASAGDGGGGRIPSLTADMLVAAVPGLDDLAEIDARQFRQMPSPHLGLADIVALAEKILSAETPVVVTQGTDNIEETAFALDLMIGRRVPVVVTGAMRNPTLPGADGPANLLAAVQTALDRRAASQGVVVVLNDEIQAARYVAKTHSTSPATFQAPGAARLGHLVEGRVVWLATLDPLPHLGLPQADVLPRVALLIAALGEDGLLVEAAMPHVQGIVVAAMGGGHVPPAMVTALSRAAEAMPVVVATRTGSGSLLGATYGFAGGEMDLMRNGLRSAGWLAPLKARVLLSLVLATAPEQLDETLAFFG